MPNCCRPAPDGGGGLLGKCGSDSGWLFEARAGPNVAKLKMAENGDAMGMCLYLCLWGGKLSLVHVMVVGDGGWVGEGEEGGWQHQQAKMKADNFANFRVDECGKWHGGGT